MIRGTVILREGNLNNNIKRENVQKLFYALALYIAVLIVRIKKLKKIR